MIGRALINSKTAEITGPCSVLPGLSWRPIALIFWRKHLLATSGVTLHGYILPV